MHTATEIMEEMKSAHGWNKRDFPEFPANKVLTPEEFIDYRLYFLMIAQVQGVTETIDPNHDPTYIRHKFLAMRRFEEVNYLARRVQHGLAKLYQNIPSFTPVSSGNVPRFYRFSMDENDLTSNV